MVTAKTLVVLLTNALLIQMGRLLGPWGDASVSRPFPPAPPLQPRGSRSCSSRGLGLAFAQPELSPHAAMDVEARATEAGLSPEQSDATHIDSYAVRLGDGTLLHRKRLAIGNATGHKKAIARAVEMLTPDSIVMDLRWIDSDAHLLVNIDPDGGDLQVWMTRLEVCEGASGIVRNFFQWYNDFDEHCRDTCCVKEPLADQSILGNDGDAKKYPDQCAVMDKQDSADQIWVGLYRNHWACPAGMRPRKLSLVGRDETCCDFFKAQTDKKVGKCGRTDCAAGLDVGYCDPVPADDKEDRILDPFIAGARTQGDGPEESACFVEDSQNRDGCEKANSKARQEAAAQHLAPGMDDSCAWCVLVNQKTNKKVDTHRKIKPKCQVCSRVPEMLHSKATTLMEDGLKWSCESFGPAYPCGTNKGGSGPGIERVRKDASPDAPFHQGGMGHLSSQQMLDPAVDAVFDRGSAHVPNYMSRGQAPGTEPMAARDLRFSGRRGFGGLNSACPVSRVQLASSEEPTAGGGGPGALEEAKGNLESLMADVLSAGLGVDNVESALFPVLKASGKLTQPSRMPFRSATQHFFSESFDGRPRYAVMGCPGGDMGQLIVALMVLEQNIGSGRGGGAGGAGAGAGYRLGNTEVEDFLQDYLLHMALPDPKLGPTSGAKTKLYMATDADSLIAWGDAVGVKNPMQPNGHAEAGRLVEAAGIPEHVGSKHLQQMLMFPERYGLRRALLVDLIKAYVKIMYDEAHPARSRLLFVANTGAWNPKGVIYVDRADDYPCGETSCLVVPQSPTGEQYFVIHRAAASLYRETLANFVAKALVGKGAETGTGRVDAQELKRQMDEMADAHLQESVKVLAQGVGELTDGGARAGTSPGPALPAYVASYSAEGMRR